MKDACKRLSCGKTKAYQLINSGVLDRVKLGRATRITLASIHRAAGL
ncbi:helix-turn-helix domain-containing protein [Sphingomonas sp. J315]